MLTREQVEHVALLARLELSEEEKDKYARQLNDILGYIEMLDRLDTENVPPTAHVLPLKNVFREDEVCDHMPNEKALANAPAREGGSFKVPKIV
ncbi:MAG: Asp-tRNA(Asn)/Glu-tRNA(Gln) amidotransferase subunit GatC [Bacillota bacterium]|jgi:aspartyl-tRNA(Asn)/glutamyl-tRNA(Gln) amidotransferase subunit C